MSDAYRIFAALPDQQPKIFASRTGRAGAGLTDPRGRDGGTALCLSGGGYRAVAFHTGALWRLNELGRLGPLGRIAAVSGGAALAGHLARVWPQLAFSGGVASNFVELVVTPMKNLLDVTIGTPAALAGLLPGRTAAGELARYFRDYLYGDFALGGMQAGPDFVFCATDLRHGALWIFGKSEMGNDQTGWFESGTVPLATAIAASAAFPPLLAPARLDLGGYPRMPKSPDLTTGRYDSAVLCDGGVYDDLALDPVFNTFATVLISDANELLPVRAAPASNWVSQLMRVREIAMSQVWTQRLDRARAAFAGNLPAGTVFGLTAEPPDATDFQGFDAASVTRLATLPTSFVRMDAATQDALINWGYVICTMQMRAAFPRNDAPARLPYPIV